MNQEFENFTRCINPVCNKLIEKNEACHTEDGYLCFDCAPNEWAESRIDMTDKEFAERYLHFIELQSSRQISAKQFNLLMNLLQSKFIKVEEIPNKNIHKLNRFEASLIIEDALNRIAERRVSLQGLTCPSCNSNILEFIDFIGYEGELKQVRKYLCHHCDAYFQVTTFTQITFEPKSMKILKVAE
ncbi:MAG: hypothetical protein ACYC25_08965 [Paludibacter sp.]